MAFMSLALIFSAFFTGAAFYINIAEQPARLQLRPAELARQWTASYKRGFAMQASLAVLSAICGGVAYYQSLDLRWLVGALAILSNWPFTLAVMMPLNHKIEATDPDKADPMLVENVRRWGQLHAVRTGLGFIATAVYFWALQDAPW